MKYLLIPIIFTVVSATVSGTAVYSLFNTLNARITSMVVLRP